jgi:4-oxalocrotonate tautomerase
MALKNWKESTMPFVSIRILKGHSKERKDEIARRVSSAISDVANLPREAIWVVFEDVDADDWYVAGERVSQMNAKKAEAAD